MNNFFWACSASSRLSKEELKDVASVWEMREGGGRQKNLDQY